jgi:hypothetical protein
VAAVVAFVVGSLCVVCAAMGSTGPNRPGTAAVKSEAVGHEGAIKAPNWGAQASVGPTTQAVAQNLAPPTPSSPLPPNTIPPAPLITIPPAPSTTLAPVVTAPAVKAPAVKAPAVTAPARPVQAAPVVAGQGSTLSAQVATELVRAVNQQSHRTEALPVTANNVSLLESWIRNEGGLWADNPLNTSLDSAAYPHQFTTSGQDTGIPIFPNLAAGLAATATTLLSNPSYARILQVLKSGKGSCVSFATAVIQSPWASGHYGNDPARFCSGIVAPVRVRHVHHHVHHRR